MTDFLSIGDDIVDEASKLDRCWPAFEEEEELENLCVHLVENQAAAEVQNGESRMSQLRRELSLQPGFVTGMVAMVLSTVSFTYSFRGKSLSRCLRVVIVSFLRTMAACIPWNGTVTIVN